MKNTTSIRMVAARAPNPTTFNAVQARHGHVISPGMTSSSTAHFSWKKIQSFITGLALATAAMLFASMLVNAAPLQIADLRLKPAVQCKGAGRPAPETKETHYTNQDFLRPDVKNEEHSLKIFVCAPWVEDAIREAERNAGNTR